MYTVYRIVADGETSYGFSASGTLKTHTSGFGYDIVMTIVQSGLSLNDAKSRVRMLMANI